jgi:hypothetical protein
MNAQQNWAFVRIVLEVPLAVVNGSIAAPRPEKDPSIKAFHKVFKTVALR